MSFLEGKKIVIMGVANKRSIAWGCAEAMMKQGAEIIYTYQNERMKKSLVKTHLRLNVMWQVMKVSKQR